MNSEYQKKLREMKIENLNREIETLKRNKEYYTAIGNISPFKFRMGNFERIDFETLIKLKPKNILFYLGNVNEEEAKELVLNLNINNVNYLINVICEFKGDTTDYLDTLKFLIHLFLRYNLVNDLQIYKLVKLYTKNETNLKNLKDLKQDFNDSKHKDVFDILKNKINEIKSENSLADNIETRIEMKLKDPKNKQEDIYYDEIKNLFNLVIDDFVLSKIEKCVEEYVKVATNGHKVGLILAEVLTRKELKNNEKLFDLLNNKRNELMGYTNSNNNI